MLNEEENSGKLKGFSAETLDEARTALSEAGFEPSDAAAFERRKQDLIEGLVQAASNDAIQATGLKVLNIARDALNDAGHHVSAPGESEPGEFYLEIDGIDVAVRVEII